MRYALAEHLLELLAPGYALAGHSLEVLATGYALAEHSSAVLTMSATQVAAGVSSALTFSFARVLGTVLARTGHGLA